MTIRNRRHNGVTGNTAPRVAIVGDYDRRAFVKHLLGNRVTVVGELASDRKVHLLAEVAPEIVFLVCGSEHVNALNSLPRLAMLPGDPLIVALTAGTYEAELTERVLRAYGADRVFATGDTRALTTLVGCMGDSTRGRTNAAMAPAAA